MSDQGIRRQNGPRKNDVVDLKVNYHVWSVASTEDIPYGFITLFNDGPPGIKRGFQACL